MEDIIWIGYELIGLKLLSIKCLFEKEQRKEKLEDIIETVVGIIVIIGITTLSCLLGG